MSGSTPSDLRVRSADLFDDSDRDVIVELTDAYARDPMGGGEALPKDVRRRMVEAMRDHGNVRVLLAYRQDQPVGICTSVVSFSTFDAAPLLNLHDLAVLPDHRNKGVGGALLEEAENLAKQLGCDRMSLEVLDHNPAKRLYRRKGFEPRSEFWIREL